VLRRNTNLAQNHCEDGHVTRPTASRSTRLDRRRLNRALLARQLLLERQRTPPLRAVERLVGLQAQAPLAPYTGLWSRLDGFDPNDLGAALEARTAVRIALMRGTVFLVTAADCLMIRPLVQRIFDRDLGTNTAYAADLRGLDREAFAAAARELCEERPRTTRELGEALSPQFGGRPPTAMVHAARALLPLVQVPPRAVWGRSGQVRYTTAEAWLGRPLDPAPDIGQLVRRYLAAFGPATVADVQAWSGLRGLGEVVERLRPELRLFHDEDDRELFDLARAPRPRADTPAPVRFIAEYDNLTLAHADRRRIVADAHRSKLMTVNGQIVGTVLVDGFVQATWRIEKRSGAAHVHVRPLEPIPASERDEVLAEGHRVLAFAAPGKDHDVHLVGEHA
jgi:hypothetical protein